MIGTLAKLKIELTKVEKFLNHDLATGSNDFNELIKPLSEAGGKRLRASLCLLIAGAGKCEEKDRIALAAAVEMLHLATLIHDDVLDQAELRRGVTAIHCQKGNKVAILSGDYLFSKAFSIVAKLESIPCLEVFSRTISALVEGEFLQMEDIGQLEQGLDRYLIKTQKKTADFIEACMELGGIIGHWEENQIQLLKEYGHALGMAFQLTDDIMDYQAKTKTTGKPAGQDLREGVLTYPILSVLDNSSRDFLQKETLAVRSGTKTPDELIQYVYEHGGVAKTSELANNYVQKAIAALDELPDFTGKEFLYEAVNHLADRKV